MTDEVPGLLVEMSDVSAKQPRGPSRRAMVAVVTQFQGFAGWSLMVAQKRVLPGR